MGLFFWAVSLLIPFIIIVMGLVFRFRPPRKINSIYGYRTTRSMASQEAWDAAHSLGAGVWLRLGPMLVVVTIIANLAVPLPPETLMMILLALDLACVIAPVPYVEAKLKQRFGK